MKVANFIQFSKKINDEGKQEVYSHKENKWIEEKEREPLKEIVEHSRIFEITNEMKKLLILTNTPKQNESQYIKSPYPNIFLDVEFTKEEMEEIGLEIDEDIIGLLLTQSGIELEGEIKSIGMRATILNGDLYESFDLVDSIIDGKKIKVVTSKESLKKRDFLNKFVLNFLNFINNPEVEWVEHKRSEANIDRRKRQGKPIIPSTATITLTGKLKKYIDDLYKSNKFEYGFRFWVRGHFRNLDDERYKEKKRIWILPYTKGEGILIEKTYKIKREQEEENKKD